MGKIKERFAQWCETKAAQSKAGLMIESAEKQWKKRRGKGQPHKLPGELIISLTSYPPRFPFVERTVKSLLSQSVKPDRIILWVAEQDSASLPAGVVGLQKHGLEIRTCADMRSYKKLVPAVLAFPEAFIVTADDDFYYGPTWLAAYVDAYRNSEEILCQRARCASVGYDGQFTPYASWPLPRKEISAPAVMPVGVEGVFYPPQALPQEALDSGVFMQVCPEADDLWFYWMGSRNGRRFRKIGGDPRLDRHWPGSQDTALYRDNVDGGGNDKQIASLIDAMGPPAGFAGLRKAA